MEELKTLIITELNEIKQRLNVIEKHEQNSQIPKRRNQYLASGATGNRVQGYRRGDTRVFTRNHNHTQGTIYNLAGGRSLVNPQNRRNNRASNPQVTTLSKQLYQRIQLRHHARNWEEIPKSICKQFDTIFNNIVPPLPNESSRSNLLNLNNNCKSSLVALILEHITTADEELKASIFSNDFDNLAKFDEAAANARDMLIRHFKRKINVNDINNWLADDLKLLQQHADTAAKHTRDHLNSNNWSSPAKTNKRPLSTTVSPVITENRFDILQQNDQIDNEAPGPSGLNKTPNKRAKINNSPRSKILLHAVNNGTTNSAERKQPLQISELSKITRPNSMLNEPALEQEAGENLVLLTAHSPVTVDLPPKQSNSDLHAGTNIENYDDELHHGLSVDSSFSDLERDSTNEITTKVADRVRDILCGDQLSGDIHSQPEARNTGKVVVHTESPKNAWFCSVKEETKVLIIADSNMRAARDIPSHWEVHVFPGAYLNHVSLIIDKLKPSSYLRDIVIAAGINNRKWPPKDSKKDLYKAYNSATKKNVAVHFLGISIPPEITEDEKYKIKELNKAAKEKFNRKFINSLQPLEVSVSLTDTKYKIHYDQKTLDKILSNVKLHFLSLDSLKRKMSV